MALSNWNEAGICTLLEAKHYNWTEIANSKNRILSVLPNQNNAPQVQVATPNSSSNQPSGAHMTNAPTPSPTSALNSVNLVKKHSHKDRDKDPPIKVMIFFFFGFSFSFLEKKKIDFSFSGNW